MSATIAVTEPTCEGGVWTLSKFIFVRRRHFSRVDIEDMQPYVLHQVRDDWLMQCMDEMNQWLRDLPPVHRWTSRPEVVQQNEYSMDRINLRYWAGGVFALGDEPQMEKLLAQVNTHALISVPDVAYTEMRPNNDADGNPIRTTLRQGTANNDLNPLGEPPRASTSRRDALDVRLEQIEFWYRRRRRAISDMVVGEGERRRLLHELDREERQDRERLILGEHRRGNRVVARGPRVDWTAGDGFIDWDAAYRRASRTEPASPGEQAAVEAARRLEEATARALASQPPIDPNLPEVFVEQFLTPQGEIRHRVVNPRDGVALTSVAHPEPVNSAEPHEVPRLYTDADGRLTAETTHRVSTDSTPDPSVGLSPTDDFVP
jgi:hypothetical protein